MKLTSVAELLNVRTMSSGSEEDERAEEEDEADEKPAAVRAMCSARTGGTKQRSAGKDVAAAVLSDEVMVAAMSGAGWCGAADVIQVRYTTATKKRPRARRTKYVAKNVWWVEYDGM